MAPKKTLGQSWQCLMIEKIESTLVSASVRERFDHDDSKTQKMENYPEHSAMGAG